MRKSYDRAITVNRKEALVLLNKEVLTGKIFRATFVMMPKMVWTKKLLCNKGLPPSWGFARTFTQARHNVKVHLKNKVRPIKASTDHIQNTVVQSTDPNKYIRKYAIVFLMDEFKVAWNQFLTDNPEIAELDKDNPVREDARQDVGNKFYRNLNFETVRTFKTEGLWFKVSPEDIPNQLLSEDETNHLVFV